MLLVPALGGALQRFIISGLIFMDFSFQGDIAADIEAILQQHQIGQQSGDATVAIVKGMNGKEIHQKAKTKQH